MKTSDSCKIQVIIAIIFILIVFVLAFRNRYQKHVKKKQYPEHGSQDREPDAGTEDFEPADKERLKSMPAPPTIQLPLTPQKEIVRNFPEPEQLISAKKELTEIEESRDKEKDASEIAFQDCINLPL